MTTPSAPRWLANLAPRWFRGAALVAALGLILGLSQLSAVMPQAAAAEANCFAERYQGVFCVRHQCPSVETWKALHAAGQHYDAWLDGGTGGFWGAWTWNNMNYHTVNILTGVITDSWVLKRGPSSGVSAYYSSLTGNSCV